MENIKVSVVIPTYNERENLKDLIPEIFKVFRENNINGNIIVVDDNSPDGTAEAVEEIKEEGEYPIELIRRPEKLGIGSAYITGFRKALELNSDVVFEMDADFSHNPKHIPEFLNNLKGNDVVIGSRYVPGGGIENWGLYRKMVSRGANTLARLLTGLAVEDITAGYRAYKSEVLRRIDLNSIKSGGYAFQLEMLYRVKEMGFKIKEIPITFKERMEGKSKLSKMDAINFFISCLSLWLEGSPLKTPIKYINKNKHIIAYILLLLMIMAYAFTLSRLTVIQHDIIGTSGFDLGIQDQGVWLISQGKMPFSTVRGLHLFGDHVTPIHILIAPLYWIWNDVWALLVLQSVLLALGGIPIYLIGRDRLNNNWYPLVFVFSYLMYPALHYLNFEQFHPDALATPFLLFAFYFITKKRHYLYGIFIFLTLLCKEEISLTVFALGVYVAIKHNKRVGILTSICAVIWLLLAIKVILPYFNGFGYFRHLYGYSVFGNLGHSPLEIISNVIKNPDLVTSQLFTEVNRDYIFNLLAPVGFLSLFSLSSLAIAVPAILCNTMSGYYYTHFIKYHYTAAIIPFIFISLIYGVSRLKKARVFRRALFFLVIATLITNWYTAPYSTSIKNFSQTYERITNFNRIPTEKEEAIMEGMKLIPGEASLSATPFFVPQFTHREKIYVFPNPFRQSYWGINGENPPPKDVEYVFLDGNVLSDEMEKTRKAMMAGGGYTKIFDERGIILFKKIRNDEFNNGDLHGNSSSLQ